MDKVAFYEEMILNDILTKEASFDEEQLLQDVHEAAVEKIAATKYKEMLARGDLSRKTKNILKFNQGRGAFDAPVQNLGSRMDSISNVNPTRNIIGAKVRGFFNQPDKSVRKMSDAFGRQMNMENKGLKSVSKYHGEKNIIPSPFEAKRGLSSGEVRYR